MQSPSSSSAAKTFDLDYVASLTVHDALPVAAKKRRGSLSGSSSGVSNAGNSGASPASAPVSNLPDVGPKSTPSVVVLNNTDSVLKALKVTPEVAAAPFC